MMLGVLVVCAAGRTRFLLGRANDVFDMPHGREIRVPGHRELLCVADERTRMAPWRIDDYHDLFKKRLNGSCSVVSSSDVTVRFCYMNESSVLIDGKNASLGNFSEWRLLDSGLMYMTNGTAECDENRKWELRVLFECDPMTPVGSYQLPSVVLDEEDCAVLLTVVSQRVCHVPELNKRARNSHELLCLRLDEYLPSLQRRAALEQEEYEYEEYEDGYEYEYE